MLFDEAAIPDEKRDTFRDGLAILCIELHLLDGPPAVICVD